MYLIIKATPFKLSTHTVIEQSSVRKATLGVQRYMVIDGSAKIVEILALRWRKSVHFQRSV